MTYRGGQGSIIHLQTDLAETVAWAEANGLRWAFTLSNAGAYYFEDRSDMGQLGEIDWAAVDARDWKHRKEGKQAEFLIERRFPWELISQVGVFSRAVYNDVRSAVQAAVHRPAVAIQPDWYY